MTKKILFALQEVEFNLKYDLVLLQSIYAQYTHSLQNENIKTDLQTYLLLPATSDKLLLERLMCQWEREAR